MKLTKQNQFKAIKMHTKGLTLRAIACQFDISHQAVWEMLKRHGALIKGRRKKK